MQRDLGLHMQRDLDNGGSTHVKEWRVYTCEGMEGLHMQKDLDNNGGSTDAKGSG